MVHRRHRLQKINHLRPPAYNGTQQDTRRRRTRRGKENKRGGKPTGRRTPPTRTPTPKNTNTKRGAALKTRGGRGGKGGEEKNAKTSQSLDPPRRAKERPRWPKMGPRWARKGPSHNGPNSQDNSGRTHGPILGHLRPSTNDKCYKLFASSQKCKLPETCLVDLKL